MRKFTVRSLSFFVAAVAVAGVLYYLYTQRSAEGFQSIGRAKKYLETINNFKPIFDNLNRKRINSITKKLSPEDQKQFDEAKNQLDCVRGAGLTEFAGIMANIKNRLAKPEYSRTPEEKTRLAELYEEKRLYEQVNAALANHGS